MKNKFGKKTLYHAMAIAIFLAISFAYFNPVLQNKELVQSDMINVEGMAKELKDHQEKTGEYAQWTNSMFGGMPAYQIYSAPPSNIYFYLGQTVQKPFPYMSLAIILMSLISFYILLSILGVSPWLSIIGAFTFAFCSYNFIIIEAGHITKAYAIATLPLVVAGFVSVFSNKKLLAGGLLLAVGLGINIAQSHFQITYYLFMAMALYVLIEFIYSIKEKTLPRFGKSLAITIVATILAILPNLHELYKTYDYGKESMRGPSELTLDNSRNTNGLDKDYAFSWSYGKMETFTLFIPGFYGNSSHYELSKNSNLYKELVSKGVPEGNARESIQAVPAYWGAQPFTSGPVYVGAIVVFLFVLGLIIVKNKFKWWLLAITILGIVLSWGKNLPGINYLFFDFFPGYNKFRTVSMILVIPSFSIVLLGILALKEFIAQKLSKEELKKALIISGGFTAGIAALFALLGGGMFDFIGSSDQTMLANGFPQWYLDALVADRISMLRGDAFRSFVLIILSAGGLWLYNLKKVNLKTLLISISILMFIDLWTVNKRFLNDDDFVPKRKIANSNRPSENDLMILEDKDLSYRVFNIAGNPFNDSRTSYFHKSIGGYHGAKLRRYQEVIESQFSNGINVQVLNMLNTRYFIAPSQDGRPVVQRNVSALGNAWFVDTLIMAKNADEEMQKLGKINTSTTAVVDQRFEKLTKDWSQSKDSLSNIKLVEYKPDYLKYEVDAQQNELLVFSEIYYPKYWESTIDGQDAAHFRANYILRSMIVPKGKHIVEFKFKPDAWNLAERISFWSSVIIGLLIVFYLVHRLKFIAKKE
ncbi:MAG: hypothetical protein PHI36_06800 [Bacteroidales bacterium]|nr:hypothetical protein [Bacteroidales bacterium]